MRFVDRFMCTCLKTFLVRNRPVSRLTFGFFLCLIFIVSMPLLASDKTEAQPLRFVAVVNLSDDKPHSYRFPLGVLRGIERQALPMTVECSLLARQSGLALPSPQCQLVRVAGQKGLFWDVYFSDTWLRNLKSRLKKEPELRSMLPLGQAELILNRARFSTPMTLFHESFPTLQINLVDTVAAPQFARVAFFTAQGKAHCRFWIWDPHRAHLTLSLSHHADLYETHAAFASFERPGFLPLKRLTAKDLEEPEHASVLGPPASKLRKLPVYFGEYSWGVLPRQAQGLRLKPAVCRMRLSNGYLVNETAVLDGETKTFDPADALP